LHELDWKWRNQYGSILEVKDDSIIEFLAHSGQLCRTALPDSGFLGQEIDVMGVHYGDCIGLTAGGIAPAGDMVVTYKGATFVRLRAAVAGMPLGLFPARCRVRRDRIQKEAYANSIENVSRSDVNALLPDNALVRAKSNY
jgi:hypothetical protein